MRNLDDRLAASTPPPAGAGRRVEARPVVAAPARASRREDARPRRGARSRPRRLSGRDRPRPRLARRARRRSVRRCGPGKIKGTKKLVEALDAYHRLFRIARRPRRGRRSSGGRRRSRAVTREDTTTARDPLGRRSRSTRTRPRTCAPPSCSTGSGSTWPATHSASRPCQGRLDAHMKERGAHQRRAFHACYRTTSASSSRSRWGRARQGLVAGRANPVRALADRSPTRSHEVFAAYDYGDALGAARFSDADRAYPRATLGKLGARWLRMDAATPIWTAELRRAASTSCASSTCRSTRPGSPICLDSQNADGSWG